MFPAVSFFPELFESQLIGPSVTPLLDLEADTGVTVSNVDKVDVWADQSGNGYNFTQTGTARPALATVGGYPCLQFDGSDDWMIGQNWAALDNMSSFTMFMCYEYLSTDDLPMAISKVLGANPGWLFEIDTCQVVTSGSNYMICSSDLYYAQMLGKHIWSMSYYPTATTLDLRQDGVADNIDSNIGTVSNYSNTESVIIGKTYTFSRGNLFSIRIYPFLNSAQRIAVTQALANRYGVVL